MKVSNRKCRNWRSLRDVRKGTAVQFKCQFHQDMCTDDLYIVIDASAYPNHDNQCKMAVVNLRTGRLSYVNSEREIEAINATVCIDE